MFRHREEKVRDIVEDKALSRPEKIRLLKEIESEARGLQRAASESAMNADDGLDADLRTVRKALDELSAKPPPKGPATL